MTDDTISRQEVLGLVQSVINDLDDVDRELGTVSSDARNTLSHVLEMLEKLPVQSNKPPK